MSQSLEGRVAIVTGAGSLPGRGIGRKVVANLATKGARVLAVDLDEQTAQETAELCRADGHDVQAMRVDVTSLADVKAMVAATMERWGRVDILVNHAGFGSYLALLETDDAHWERMIALNLTSVFQACREVIPHMMKNERGGVILNTISIAGMAGGRAGLAYTAAKHGAVGITRSIAVTYGKRKIRCVGICPGLTRSPLPQGVPPQILPSDSKEDAAQIYGDFTRLFATEGRPEQLADVIGFLATDEASFINGSIIPIDGGWTAL